MTRYLTLDYLLAEVLQRVFGADRLKDLRRTRAHFEKYLENLDNYDLLTSDDKKLLERYLESPNSFTLTLTNDAAARRQAKISRFREEKELKQKLEVPSESNLAYSKLSNTGFAVSFSESRPGTKR